MTTYAPDPSLLRHGITCCDHCGQVPAAHHSTGQCYTQAELAARLSFWQREGRWPEPDEGCTPEDASDA